MSDDAYKFYQPVWARPGGPGHIERDRGLILDPSKDLPAPPAPKSPILEPIGPTLPVVPRPSKPPIVRGKGPFNVFEPIAGDPYRYPEPPPPPSLPLATKLDAFICHQARKFVDRRGRPYAEDRDQLPDENRKRLPAPDASLYWMGDKAEVQDYASSMVSASALGNPKALVEQASKQVRDMSTGLALMNTWLAQCGIRHFRAHELIRHKWRRSRGRNQDLVSWWFMFDHFDAEVIPTGIFAVVPRLVLPPPWLWPNILPSLRVLDRFRHWLGDPVTVYSAYRHPHYNFDHVKKASKNSFHMDFAAIDFTYPRRMRGGHLDSRVFVQWFETHYRQTGDGVGRYHKPAGNFIHLDVGLNRHKIKGKALNWWKPDEHPRLMP